MRRVIKASRVFMLDKPETKGSPGGDDSQAGPGGESSVKVDLDSARMAADEMLALAREEASHLIRKAREEALAVSRDAEREAASLVEKSQLDAYRQGLAQAEADIGDLFERAQAEVDGIINDAKEQRNELLDSMEPRVFRLALEIAEKILGYELDRNESAFMSMLRSALSNVKNESTVTLRVNSSEYVRFFKSREVTMHTQSGTLQANVVNDPTIGFGGCLIETESGAIDAGASAQLSQIGKNLGLEADESHGD